MGSFGEPVSWEEIPDLAEPIRAWRVWRIGQFRGQWGLRSARIVLDSRMPQTISHTDDRGIYWPVGGIEARCLCVDVRLDGTEAEMNHECPCPPRRPELLRRTWGCGIYAMRTRGDLVRSDWVTGSHVLGQVELGGRIWTHDLGYRAQYARVAALEQPLTDMAFSFGWSPMIDVLRKLADRYRVPLEFDANREGWI